MTLQQLRYIIEVSRCGSISAAAQNLFIAQPSLSKAIRDLEEELGTTLMERSRHGVAFTVEGMEFLGYATRILEQSNHLQEHFTHRKSQTHHLNLKISAQHYLFVTDALITFINGHDVLKDYTVVLREGPTVQTIHDVVVQKSQIGIVFISNLTQSFMNRVFLKNNLDFTPFGEFPPYAYLNRRHPLAEQREVSIDQLSHYPYVRYEQGINAQQYAEELIIPEGTTRTIYVTDCMTLMNIINNTHTYTIGSGCILPGVIDPDIVSIPISNRLDRMTIGWIKLKNVTMSEEMENFVEIMPESLRKCTWGNRYTDNMYKSATLVKP